MYKPIIFLLLFITGTAFQPDTTIIPYTFERFPYFEKLPSNSVIRIYNDKDGYMWFGTKDGLCRFDGYNVKVFRSSASTPGKLSNNEIQCITEDNNQRLWVGTVEGINIIDKKNFSIRQLDNKYINRQIINSILVDSKGYVWIASNNGVLRIEPNSGDFERFSTENTSRLKLKGNVVIHIYEDKSGKIWFSSWKNGLSYIDKSCKKITYLPDIGNSNNPFRFFQDNTGLYWICTWGDGMYTMSMDTDKINIHPLQLSDKTTSKENIVYSITQDNTFGYLWVVTFNGLRYIKKETDGRYSMIDAGPLFGEVPNKLFHEIIMDKWGNLWAGSVGNGIYKLDFNKLSIKNYPLTEMNALWNVSSNVTLLCELSSQEVLIVINRVGLFYFNTETGEIRRPKDPIVRNIQNVSAMVNVSESNEIWLANEGEDIIHILKMNSSNELKQEIYFPVSSSNTSVENWITCLFEDSEKNIWIGSDKGLYIKGPGSPVRGISKNIQSVISMEEDAEKNIWIGTDKGGIFVCKPIIQGNQTLYPLSKVPLKIGDYQSYSVQSICCGKNGDVYIGTKEGCLYFYNPKNHIATDISSTYGITDEGIMDILEDNNGMLWISTAKKIIRYNPVTHTSTYYSSADGLLTSMFFKNANLKLKSGQILFGGNQGISIFDPLTLILSQKAQRPRVFISDILIQNKSIFDDKLNEHYDSRSNRVTLQHTESNLGIEFSALDLSSANKNQYAYRMSGIDHTWNYVGNNRRFINYANLPPGKYRFNVMANDENGLWSNQATSLEILILPPLYKSWWAYITYFFIIVAASYFVIRTLINRIRLRNKLKISQIEKEKSEELAQIKLRYFTNISHELLTPLTIIQLVAESLKLGKSRNDPAQYEMLHTNASRLKRLIQQILVFRKAESGNIRLKISSNDIVDFIKNICYSSFQPLIIKKKINFSIQTEKEHFDAWFDPDKLDKMVYNLLSNAFKYTSPGGNINLKLSFTERNKDSVVRLSVSDTGSGIPEKDLPHIFRRFYTSSKSDPGQSHGIGLSLTRELLQLHKGSIEVKSNIGEGSVFTIELPVSRGAYAEEELLTEESNEPAISEDITEIILSESNIKLKEEDSNFEDYTLLVVEDDLELLKLIVDYFSKSFKVLKAENGYQALEMVRENKVDLVISDVMMPEMDGLTFCKKLKNDILTSHVHILMLTARNSVEDRIDCYNAGADAYIAKPFELRVLVARVNNLIRQRKQKTEDFKSNKDINISSMEYGSMDEEFLKRAVLKVETKLSDSYFDLEQFAVDMGASKSTLRRKMESLTGLAPVEFIRNIRLKHAAKMLENKSGNISEIAFSVGFNNPKYFTRCFKAEFGITPREYQDSKNGSEKL